MISKSKSKLLALVAALAVAFGMMPSQIFAATQTEYKIEGGANIGYQKITVDDTVFNDMNKDLEGELSKSNEAKLASKIIGQWSPLAVDIFDSETAVWGLRNSPTYINSLSLTFAESLKHSGSETDRKIDLKTWLADSEPRKIDTDSEMKSTGIQKTTTLSNLRDAMAAHIEGSLKDVYGEDKSALTSGMILGAAYDKLPNHVALDKFIKEIKGKDVYYSLVTSINKSSNIWGSCAYYNSYAVAVYDVTLSPVISESKEGLSYVNQQDKGSQSLHNEYDYIAKVNDTGEELTTNIKQDNLKKQTMENSLTARTNRLALFADPVGDSHWNNLPFLDTIGNNLLRSTDPVKAMNSSAYQPYTNEENNYTYKNVTMPADTCVKAHKTSVKTKTEASYNAPYAIDYKIAVFSLAGRVDHPADKSKMNLFSCGDFVARFDKNTTGAVENLALRTSDDARHSSSYESNYGDTLGCVKSEADMKQKVYWFDKTLGFVDDSGNPDHGGGHYTKSIVSSQSGNIDKITKSDRMLTSGDGAMKLETERVEGQAYDELVPVRPLTQVTTRWQHDTGRELLHISLNKDRAWNLGAIAVEGYNDKDNPYYGFDGSAAGGNWVVCDENGTEIDPSESPLKIVKKEGTQILLTENEGTGYIRWKIDRDVFYENGVEPLLMVGRDNTPSYPIEIKVLPQIPDDAKIVLVPDGDLSVAAGEDLNLNEHIETVITGGDEPDETIPGKFFIDEDTSEASVSPEGIFSAKTPGIYEVRGAMMIDETKLGLTSENTVTVTVTDKRAPGKIVTIEPPEGELSPTCSRVGYDLLSLVSVQDNYGEPWDGKGSYDFNFSGGGKTIGGKAHINDGDGRPCLIVDSPGTYQVVASYQEDDVKLENTITFKVHQIIGIAHPVTVKPLIYNGKLQTGVTAEEGCLLSDEKATEAGNYEAKAKPAPGYAWMDGSTDEVAVDFEITKQPITFTAENKDCGDLNKENPFTFVMDDEKNWHEEEAPDIDFKVTDGSDNEIDPKTAPAGKYKITPSWADGKENNNYDATFIAGEFNTVHDISKKERKEPTCTEDGAKERYECGICGKYFSDEQGTTEIPASDVIIPATGHDWHLAQNDVGWTADSSKDPGDPDYYNAAGTWKCKNDSRHTQEETAKSVEVRNVIEPACTQEGSCEYHATFESPEPGKYEAEMMIKEETIPAKGHMWSAEWNSDGDKHWHECTVCHEKNDEANHTWDKGVVTKKATTTATGVKTFTCGTCKATKKETIPKLAKKKNTLKVKGKTAKIKYKKLKKKTQTLKVSKVIKFTKKGQGKMSYKKSSVTYTKAKSVKMSKKALKKYKKKVAKKIKINTQTGKVTVKKGLKKGTYKVKAKVKAAGNANYKASGLKTVTFKIKVK